MTVRTLGRSDLRITPIGVGASPIGGGKWKFGWGQLDDQQSLAAIRTALENGANWIDTAASYGLGHSETVVGKAVKGLVHRPYVFTKCSLVWDQSGNISHTLQAASIRREAESSLKRLNIDVIDLYQIHWPAWKGNPESASPGSIEEAVGTLAQLKSEGKIRHIGVANFDTAQMQRALQVAPIASLQPKYSLVSSEVESSTLQFALKNDVGVIVYSPMASGLLGGAMTRERIAAFPDDDWEKRTANVQESLLSRNLHLVETLRAICRRHNATWTLRNPAVTGAIAGVRNPEQSSGVVGAANVHLNVRDLFDIVQGLNL
jgi:aryl-alcohol dehydrogenase-like predicted oxidoreductase